MDEVERLRYERKWLLEQLAGAWDWPIEAVELRLKEDSDEHFPALAKDRLSALPPQGSGDA